VKPKGVDNKKRSETSPAGVTKNQSRSPAVVGVEGKGENKVLADLNAPARKFCNDKQGRKLEGNRADVDDCCSLNSFVTG